MIGHGFDRAQLEGNTFAIGTAEREAIGAMKMAARYTTNAHEIVNRTLEIAGEVVEGIKPPYHTHTYQWNKAEEEWEQVKDYDLRTPPQPPTIVEETPLAFETAKGNLQHKHSGQVTCTRLFRADRLVHNA